MGHLGTGGLGEREGGGRWDTWAQVVWGRRREGGDGIPGHRWSGGEGGRGAMGHLV